MRFFVLIVALSLCHDACDSFVLFPGRPQKGMTVVDSCRLCSSTGKNPHSAQRRSVTITRLLQTKSSDEESDNEDEQEPSATTPALVSSDEVLNKTETSLTPSKQRSKKPEDGKLVLVRAALAAIPLMMKLFLVLSIKFLMDLIVFPLLFLYRFLRLVKNKTMKLFSSGSKVSGNDTFDPPNGATGAR